MSVAQATAETGPLAESAFEDQWAAAQRGDFTATPPEGATTPTPAPSDAPPTPPTEAPPAPQAAQVDAPPAPGQEQATQDWTPPTREEVERLSQKARHWDSFEGNKDKFLAKLQQEYTAPYQAQLDQAQREVTRMKQERAEAIEATIRLRGLSATDADALRAQVARHDTEQQLALDQVKKQFEREQQLGQRESRVQEVEVQLAYQQEAALRQFVKGTFGPHYDRLAQTYGIPRAEVAEYAKELDLENLAGEGNLELVGPTIAAIEKFAAYRGRKLAGENAQRANQNGTYRNEGNGIGTSNPNLSSPAHMPDPEFENLWGAVMGGERREPASMR